MSVKDFEYCGIYGLGGDGTSTGINTIAERLSELGIAGHTIPQEFAQRKGMELFGQADKQLIVFGYSMGATDAIDLAANLIAAGRSVPLLFTMDPHAERNQVPGVSRHINIWQPHRLLLLKRFYPVIANPALDGELENIAAKDVGSHGELDDTPWVQETFLKAVTELVADSVSPSTELESDLPWLAEADRFMGWHEQRNRKELSEYLQSDGSTVGDPSQIPWCGDFVETVIRSVLANEVVPENPYWARNWQHFGLVCKPKHGAIMVFKRGSGGHVGFYVGETDRHYIIRGGNQDNQVTDTPYTKSQLIAARWPATYQADTERTSETPALEALHKAFFDHVRRPLFDGRLKQGQVDGMKMTIGLWLSTSNLTDLRWLAYMLATAWLETDRKMQAIREYGDDAYFTRMYDIRGSRPNKARELGNLTAGDGARYCGRGKPMVTGKANYAKADRYVGDALGVSFVEKPSLVLVGDYSDRIMFSGMVDGWFTGKKLADYFNDDIEAPVNARRIVNGTDRAEEIADAYRVFLEALKNAFASFDQLNQTAVVVHKPAPDGPTDIPQITGQFDPDMDPETRKALIRLLNQAVQEFAVKHGVDLNSPQVNRLPGRGTIQSPGTQTEGKRPMLSGYKTHITMMVVLLVAISEGLLGFDIPGVEMQDNWVEYVLGAAGVSSMRDAVKSLGKSFIR